MTFDLRHPNAPDGQEMGVTLAPASQLSPAWHRTRPSPQHVVRVEAKSHPSASEESVVGAAWGWAVRVTGLCL